MQMWENQGPLIHDYMYGPSHGYDLDVVATAEYGKGGISFAVPGRIPGR